MSTEQITQDAWERTIAHSQLLTRMADAALDGWDHTDPAVLRVVADLFAFSAAALQQTPVPVGEEHFTHRLAALDREYAAFTRERAAALDDAPLPFLRAFQPDRLAALDERERLWRAEMATLA